MGLLSGELFKLEIGSTRKQHDRKYQPPRLEGYDSRDREKRGGLCNDDRE